MEQVFLGCCEAPLKRGWLCHPNEFVWSRLRMVDQIISHQIAHVPLYLGIRGILNFLDLWLFSLLDLIFYEFVQFVRVAMFIAKMDVVRISTYQFVQKCSCRQWEHRWSHDGMRWQNRTADNSATTNQQTVERRQQQRRWRQRGGSVAAMAARQQHTAWQGQRGGSSVEAAAAAAAWQGPTARRRQAMDGVTARATAINGTGQEGGTTRGRREAMQQPAGLEVPPWFTRIYVK